jgi:hypothetical protein
VVVRAWRGSTENNADTGETPDSEVAE